MSEGACARVSFDASQFFQETRLLAVPTVGCRPCTTQTNKRQADHVARFVRILIWDVNVHSIHVLVSLSIGVSPRHIDERDLRPVLRFRIPDVLARIFPIGGRRTEGGAQCFQRRCWCNGPFSNWKSDVARHKPAPIVQVEAVTFVDIHHFHSDRSLPCSSICIIARALRPRLVCQGMLEFFLACRGGQIAVKDPS